jgi:hypothetical protein
VLVYTQATPPGFEVPEAPVAAMMRGKCSEDGRTPTLNKCVGSLLPFIALGLGLVGAITMLAGNNAGLGNTTADVGGTNSTTQLGPSELLPISSARIRIVGTVTDLDGKPAPQVRVSLFPAFSAAERKTDEEGRFTLAFDPRQGGPAGEAAPILLARDSARNLAAAVELQEGATNASVRLGPALTLEGRILDPDGNALTNAQAQVRFHTERMASNLGSAVRAGAGGRFVITALPPGRQYTVSISAKGFGQEQRNVPAADAATNHLELGPFTLVRANLRLAGVVLGEDDKPVARASIYTYGSSQPNLGALTDAKGQFSLGNVCPGPIQISANARGGGFGSVPAAGGDTNITIRLGVRPGIRMSSPRTTSLKGRPLPDLAPLGLTQVDVPADRQILALVIDAEQRPSRRALRLLVEQASALKAKGIAVVVIHTGTMSEGAFRTWKQEAALPFAVGCLKGEPEKARATWGVTALPWLILTDKAHRVTAEGFDLDELDARLKALGE